MIKKLSFILSLFVAGSLTAQTSIPNGNFEQWDSVISHAPTGYFSSNLNGNLPPNAPPNCTQGPAHHGVYGVTLTTTVFGKDTGFAYITNSNGNPAQGKGGIPYAQQAKGMRFYYECSLVGKDTAIVVAVFKKAGTIIGSAECKLTGKVSSYTLYSKTISPALPMAPDSVIFAAVSSNVLSGGNGIAGSTLTIDSVTFTGVSSQPLLMNGDFENWTADSVYSPAQWFTFNAGNPRTTDKYAGKYALELNTGTPPGNNGIQAGYATDGKEVQITKNQDSVEGGFPFSHQIDSLVCYYKYSAAFAGDTAAIELQFNKSSKVIGGYMIKLPPAATYTRIVAPFNIGATPDSMIVSLTSSIGYPITTPGSVLKVDSLSLYSAIIAGIAPVANNGDIKVYPNPTTSLFYVDMKGYTGKVDMIRVLDMSGKVMETRNYNFSPLKNTVEAFDMTGYSAGTYIISISTPSGVQYQKLSKVE